MSLINSKTWLRKCKRSAKIYHAWGYMIKKIKIGKQVGFSLKKNCHCFFSIQRAYGTLKQNLVKFKRTHVIH